MERMVKRRTAEDGVLQEWEWVEVVRWVTTAQRALRLRPTRHTFFLNPRAFFPSTLSISSVRSAPLRRRALSCALVR